MGWGSTSHTVSTNTQSASNQFSNTTTPNEPQYIADLRQSFGPYLQNIMAQAQQPVYGDAAKAGYLSNLNDLANASTKHLSSTLAGRGILDSGALGLGQGDIERQKFGQYAGFLGQLPFQEQQAKLANMGGALGLGLNLTGRAPIGQTQSGTGSSNQTGSNDSTTTQNPGLSGLVGSALGIGLGAFTGGLGGKLGSSLGGMFGGGLKGAAGFAGGLDSDVFGSMGNLGQGMGAPSVGVNPNWWGI